MVQCGHADVFYINSGWWNSSRTGHSSKVFLQCGYPSVDCMHLVGWNCCHIVRSGTASLQCEWVHVFLDYRSDWKTSHTPDTDEICSRLCLSVLTEKDREMMVREEPVMLWTALCRLMAPLRQGLIVYVVYLIGESQTWRIWKCDYVTYCNKYVIY